MKAITYKRLLGLLFVFFIGFLLLGCQKDGLIKQTDEFYVNDHAHVLLNATKWTIVNYSDELYEDSSEQDYVDDKIDGAQVVVLTYAGEVGDINTTDIFNAWGIGKNNMGLFIVLFFNKSGEDAVFTDIVIEIGEKLSGYLSAFHASELIDLYFNHPDLSESDYDLRLMSLYFAFLEFIYLNVYDYVSYNYVSFLSEYLDQQYEYFGLLPSERSTGLSNIPTWVWIVLIVFGVVGSSSFLIPALFGSSGFKIFGGGGRSRGYWFRR
ncbi:MAG: hypothetical protein WC225_05965 [Acholeplasmataceae bacterium]|nr:hypothetical protein [Acholeplasmataceae bacterium]